MVCKCGCPLFDGEIMCPDCLRPVEKENKEMDKYELRDYITLRMYDEMKHCIGYEGKAKRGTYKYWRNYFCLNDNDITWDKLVEYGLATKFNRDLMVVYNLSPKGIEFISYIEGINIKEEK
jgi:hypothetical protein